MTERNKSIDNLRAISILSVVLIHVIAKEWYLKDPFSTQWIFLNIVDGSLRWCVPVFIMITGSLLLPKDLPIRIIIQKYIKKLFVAYIITSMLYLVLQENKSGSSLLYHFVTGYYHLWYLPMLAGLYLITPLLKQISKNEKVLDYFLLITFLTSIAIPSVLDFASGFIDFGLLQTFISALRTVAEKNGVGFFSGYCFYYMLGYRLSGLNNESTQFRKFHFFWIIGSCLSVLLTQLISLKANHPVETFYSYLSLNVCIESIGIFVFAINKMDYLNPFLSFINKRCFLIYLIHPFVIKLIVKKIQLFGFNSYIVKIVAMYLFTLFFTMLILEIVVLFQRLLLKKNNNKGE